MVPHLQANQSPEVTACSAESKIPGADYRQGRMGRGAWLKTPSPPPLHSVVRASKTGPGAMNSGSAGTALGTATHSRLLSFPLRGNQTHSSETNPPFQMQSFHQLGQTSKCSKRHFRSWGDGIFLLYRTLAYLPSQFPQDWVLRQGWGDPGRTQTREGCGPRPRGHPCTQLCTQTVPARLLHPSPSSWCCDRRPSSATGESRSYSV